MRHQDLYESSVKLFCFIAINFMSRKRFSFSIDEKMFEFLRDIATPGPHEIFLMKIHHMGTDGLRNNEVTDTTEFEL